MRPALPLFALVLCGFTACDGTRQVGPYEGTCGENINVIPVELNRDIDLLLVIDSSPSMADEQTSLQQHMHRFADELANIEWGLPNMHIGVISADLGVGPYQVPGCSAEGDAGLLQAAPRGDCSPPAGMYISDIVQRDGTRTRNYEGTLGDTLACIAPLGADGCRFSQPLEAARQALNGVNPENHGFLREDAMLFVVFVTDEDDCSASDRALFDPLAEELGPLTSFRCFEYGVVCDPDLPRVAGQRANCRPRQDSAYAARLEECADFFKGLKPDPNMVFISSIQPEAVPVAVGADADGNPMLRPVCELAGASATPAVRLSAFRDLFPQRAWASSICSEDYSDAIAWVATGLARVLGAPCADAPVDLEPETPGLQYECVASDVRYPGEDRQEETILPECTTIPPEPGSMPCWELRPEPNMCPDSEWHMHFEIHRGGATVPAGWYTMLRCFTGCTPP